MSVNPPTQPGDLDEVLAAILQEAEAGQPLDPAGWSDRYPHWAAEIAAFCDDLVKFGKLFGLKPVPSEQTVPFTRTDTETDTRPHPVQRIGDYDLLAELGRGGMGVVYRARRAGTDLEVALKVFHPDVTGVEELAQLRAEVNSACRLKHPHIVAIYHYGEDAGRPFFTMELIEGRSLADELPHYVGHPREAVRLMIKVARAVHHAHQRQILHRDLKPANVLLTFSRESQDRGRIFDPLLNEEVVPKITDFGLAVRLRSDGVPYSPGEIVPGGSLPWMAPEALRSERELTTAADIWALGVILYELLTGRRPYLGGPRGLRQQILQTDPPPRPRSLNPRIDRDLEAVCLKCLRKDPARRYGSAEALADDLERCLDGKIPVARGRIGTAERLFRWCRRYPGAVAGTLIVLAFLVLLPVWALAALREQEQRLIKEVCESNEFAAIHVASTVLWQLQRLADAVANTADNPQLRSLYEQEKVEGPAVLAGNLVGSGCGGVLNALVRISSQGELPKRAELRSFLEKARLTHNTHLRKVLPSTRGDPLASMVLLDEDGLHVTESPRNEKIHGKVYIGRDYFHVAIRRGKATGPARIHVSRIFPSDHDKLHKLAMSIPVKIRENGPVSGVLIATVATDSNFGLEHLNNPQHKAVLLAPRDPNPPEVAPPEKGHPLEYLVLMHPSYRYGETPVPLGRELPANLKRETDLSELDLPASGIGSSWDKKYTDPVAARHEEYKGRWLAGFATVGNTELVVVVQRRYAEAVEPHQTFLYRVLGWGAGAVLAVLVLLRGSAWILRRTGAR